jgi:predicted acyl esterase
VLPPGHKRTPYHKPIPCSIIIQKDFAVPMRDGVKLYCDIYRPGTIIESTPTLKEKVPIILVYAPYGKHGNSELFLPNLPERLGVSKDTYSGYENFEGPDPAYW